MERIERGMESANVRFILIDDRMNDTEKNVNDELTLVKDDESLYMESKIDEARTEIREIEKSIHDRLGVITKEINQQ